jgi:DNA-binding NtrC family response regulator
LRVRIGSITQLLLFTALDFATRPTTGREWIERHRANELSYTMPTEMRSAAAARSASTILLLDNDVLVRMPLAEYLRDCGYRVFESGDVAEAQTLLNARVRVDVVFARVKSGSNQNGFMLASWVRQHHPTVKVLLSSGIAKATEQAGDLCSRGPHSPVPYEHGQVLRRIQNLLRQARRAGPGKKSSYG